MKLVYAVDKKSYNNIDHVGVVKKVESQMKLFNKNGIETTLCQYEWEGGYPQIEIESDTDVLYFRRIEPSVKLIFKLYELKRKNSNIRLIMEIPTYPFSQEERGSISLKRRANRFIGEKLIRFLINRIVLIGQKKPIKKIYGIPTICVNNGIDFNSVKTCEPSTHKEGIHMICVSGCFFWHGYDRVIKGMVSYYSKGLAKEAVFLHVVGEGECLQEYKELAEKNDIRQYIHFYGKKVGDELDKIFDMCDIALEGVGGHRKGLMLSSSLKTREYAAKGLPIVSSVQLDIENEDTNKYIFKVPANEAEIEIEKIVQFYHKIYDKKDRDVCHEEIRKSFYQYCDWKYTFQEVLDYIKKTER